MAYRRRNPFDDEPDNDFEEITHSEIARIQQEKQLYENRMVESSYRSLRMIEETKDIACKTEEELARQGEALDRTEGNLDKINADIAVSERHITSMKSIFGAIGNYFRKPPASKTEPGKPGVGKATQDLAQQSSDVRLKGSDVQRATDIRWDGPSQMQTSYGQRASSDSVTDRNLDQIMTGLKELKEHGLLMGATLDDHNEKIDRITYKATEADKRVEDADKKIRKILTK